MPPRRVPIAVKGRLKSELQRLEDKGVIKKITEPTDWVSSLVVTQKANGNVRVCINPQQLNKALKRSHYPFPVIEDVLPDLSDAKVFSKADLKDGFLQIELDEESSKLTTFQSPWGRYRWLRLPFGVSPAPEYFQMKFHQNLEGLKGVYDIADDVTIVRKGVTNEEALKDHDQNLTNFLEHCRERNIKLNKAKFEVKCREVPFIGHVLSSEGLKPDPAKIEAIIKMDKTEDVAGVQRIVGMVKYLSKFLQGLYDMCEPLRRLTHKDATWIWSSKQEQAFEKIKQAVTAAPVLKYFNPKEPTKGQGDPSSKGLGFVLLQNGQPVTYNSRALTPAEQNYSQIEKELLAQVYGLEHNHQYVFGRKVILWTDHKPLVSISTKPLSSAPKRLQRLLLRMQHYDVEICYKPGSQMYLADTLSPAYLKNEARSPVEQEVETIHMIDFLPISEPQLREIQETTQCDPTLQALKKVILDGWPDLKDNLPSELHLYFSFHNELAAQDGIIFKGLRCIIPATL